MAISILTENLVEGKHGTDKCLQAGRTVALMGLWSAKSEPQEFTVGPIWM